MSEEIKRLKKELYRLGASFLKKGQEEEFRKYQEKRKELIIIECEKLHYHIAEDLRLIAKDF